MKLQDYRRKENKTQEQVAKDLNINQSMVTKWENGTIPRPDFMQKIIAYTNGEVQPNDFYEVK